MRSPLQATADPPLLRRRPAALGPPGLPGAAHRALSLGRRAEGPARRRRRWRKVEATSGFEPLNRGFADLRVKPLHHVASGSQPGDCAIGARVRPEPCPAATAVSREVVAPRGFEPRPTDPKSAVLPLDEGAAVSRPDRGEAAALTGAKKWSGRRDSNPRPSPWQGDALPTEPLPLGGCATGAGAESQIRTGDTAIFSRVLYQLSYLGPVDLADPSARRRDEG
jgi:hypothetical protein